MGSPRLRPTLNFFMADTTDTVDTTDIILTHITLTLWANLPPVSMLLTKPSPVLPSTDMPSVMPRLKPTPPISTVDTPDTTDIPTDTDMDTLALTTATVSNLPPVSIILTKLSPALKARSINFSYFSK